MVTPEEVKENYQAIKLHFNNKNYNYAKYNGKINKSKFKDIVAYSIIAKGKFKTDFPDFFIPGLFYNPKVRIDFFISENYFPLWKYWVSYQKSPRYFFENEIVDVKNYLDKKSYSFDDLFKVEKNTLPMVYKFVLRNQISPQTFLYLDQVLNFSHRISNEILEEIYYDKLTQRLNRLKTFLKDQETQTLKNIMRSIFLVDK